jgi:DNA-directed RNA polymerase subunit RPC12/RpoP
MPIIMVCKCGRELRARPESAGKKSKCPHCGVEVMIPAASTAAAPAAGSQNPSETFTYFEWGSNEKDPAKSAEQGKPTSPSAASASPDSIPIKVDDAVSAPLQKGPSFASNQKYKVLTHKEMGFAVKFDPQKLEETLNQWAEAGWRVKSTAVMEFTSHTGSHPEFVVLMEKE